MLLTAAKSKEEVLVLAGVRCAILSIRGDNFKLKLE
jgi:sRNA-binding carbon storage regulator CsrA